MKSISLYVANNSYLTKLHPFTKLLYIAAAVSIPLLSGRLWMFCTWIGVSLIILTSGKLLRKTFPLIAFSFTILLTIFLIHGLFHTGNTTVIFSIGPLHFYKEGVLYSAKIGLNILNMLLSFAVFILSTKPSEFVEELEKKGFSPRFGYIINSVFQIIPQMIGTMHTIADAQRSRGTETEGSLFTRAKALIPLISPVIAGSLINTRERAIALEVRGFGSGIKRTYLTDHPKSKVDILCRLILYAAILIAVCWRITLCLI